MKYYLAPMEGITGFVFRNAYHDYFEPMDKYFAPFISPNQNICFTPREYRDICMENNRSLHVVPQILTNKAADFIKTSQELAKMGYEEVNLNLGCPSGTVTAKRKGAGFLMEPERLRAFFDEIFERPCVKISVKTRLGMYSTDEFSQLLAIFNDYPLTELIIHPRVGKEFYDGMPHRDVYLEAVQESKNLLCYNGDLYCEKDVRELLEECRKAERGAGLMMEFWEAGRRAGSAMEFEEAGRRAGSAMEFGETGRGVGLGKDFAGECTQEGYPAGYEDMRENGDAVNGCASGCHATDKRKMQDFLGGTTVAVMFGRGILRDPWLVAKCREMEKDFNFSHDTKQLFAGHSEKRLKNQGTSAGKERVAGEKVTGSRYLDAAHIREFSDRLFSDYAQYMGEHNAMFRMKELWLYLVESFADVDANQKKLKKAQNRAELNAVLEGLWMCG